MRTGISIVTPSGLPTLDDFMARLNATAVDRGWRAGDLDGWEMSEDINYMDAAASFGLDVYLTPEDAVVHCRSLRGVDAARMAGVVA